MIGTVPTRPAVDLVGRDAELRRVREALGEAGEGGAVLLGGDAGIGKTALAGRLVDGAGARRVLVGHCVGDVGALPSPTARLRSQRSWPMRRIGEPASRSSNSCSVQANRLASGLRSRPFLALKSGISVACAKRFQGQASWQSSQP